MPATPDLIGRALRNVILLQRIGNGMIRKTNAQLAALFAELVADTTALVSLPRSLRPANEAAYATVLERARALTTPRMGQVRELLEADMADMAAWQAAVARGDLVLSLGSAERVIPQGPTSEMLRGIVASSPFQGRTLAGWTAKIGDDTADAVAQQVAAGMAQEESIEQIVRRVRGRSTGGGRYAGGVWQATRRNATAVVRTGVTHHAAMAREELYKANADIAPEYEYMATLDDRTTLICATLDGRTFKVSDPAAPRPPQHFNCRSTTMPVIDWKALGVTPPAPGQRLARQYDAKGRLTKQRKYVAEGTRYEDWLRTQPRAVQDSVLGKGRAALWRDGKVPLKRLVTKDGRVLTTAEASRKSVARASAAGRRAAAASGAAAPPPSALAATTAPQTARRQTRRAASPPRVAAAHGATAAEPLFIADAQVSAEFRRRVEQWQRSVPPAVRAKQAQYGTTVRVGNTITGAFPDLKNVRPRGWKAGMTWDAADGIYRPHVKTVLVTERRVSLTSKRLARTPPTRAQGVFYHETGHGLDDALGYVSRSAAFAKAYAADVRRISAAPRRLSDGLTYFLQSGPAGPSEAFAEGFAIVIGGKGALSGGFRTKQFKTGFPNVLALIQKLLKEL